MVLTGEYWILPEGEVLGADGDIGDYTHEAHVIEYVQNQYIPDEYGGDWEQFKQDVINEGYQNAMEQARTEPEKLRIKSTWKPDDYFYKYLNQLGMSDEEIAVAEGLLDARDYGVKNLNWKRVVGNNIDTLALTPQDINSIANGLYDIYDEEVERYTFNVFVYSSRKYFNDIPWSVLNTNNPAAFRQYQSHYESFKMWMERNYYRL